MVVAKSRHLDEEVTLERQAVRRFLQGREIKPFQVLPSGKVVLIPYRIVDGHANALSERNIKDEWPEAFRYLKRNKTYLAAREDGRFSGADWYEFGRNQNIDLMLVPKLLVPDIADRACFAIDESGQYAFTSGYGITFYDEHDHPMKFMLGLCNSRVLDFYWRKISTPLRGGFFRYFTQFIEQFPIPESTAAQRGQLVRVTDIVLLLKHHFAGQPVAETTRDPLMLAYAEQILNGLVYELYFPEEVHGAKLKLFELVEHATLPRLDSIPDREQSSRLRRLLEDLHDGAHPLKIALQKLQTLDVVRIIEGTT